ncbi:MAG: 30S ribosomal protein S17 [Candidatus Hydrogenedentota bacterium]|nr:MAG: 30S ribosomal protein S17 [Candidatus Hydrogenedentota bacterium]
MTESLTKTSKAKRTLKGVVVSAKTPKTIVVKVEYQKQHPVFKKTMRLSKKVMAHDPDSTAGEGDTVTIAESRPYSKRKHYILVSVDEKARE